MTPIDDIHTLAGVNNVHRPNVDWVTLDIWAQWSIIKLYNHKDMTDGTTVHLIAKVLGYKSIADLTSKQLYAIWANQAELIEKFG